MAHPGLEPLVVALVGELGGQNGGVLGRQQGVGPRPLLCPPGFELVGLVRIAVRVAHAGRRDHVAHDRPGPVLSQPTERKCSLSRKTTHTSVLCFLLCRKWTTWRNGVEFRLLITDV